MTHCSFLNGRCPELKLEHCDDCELEKTWLKFRQDSRLLEVLEDEAKEKKPFPDWKECEHYECGGCNEGEEGDCHLCYWVTPNCDLCRFSDDDGVCQIGEANGKSKT